MRKMLRSAFMAGLVGLSGLVGLLAASPAVWAAAPPVQIIQVVDAPNVADESFQLYNNSGKALTLDGYQICPGNTTCIKVPTATVDPFRFVEISASKLAGWPAAGLNGTADMLGLLDASGKALDSVNWGTPDPKWKNYATFKDMLYNPGIVPPAPAGKQNFFRTAPGIDNDNVKDWLAIAISGAPEVTATPGGAKTPAATPGRTATSGTTAKATPTRTPTAGGTANSVPKTGGEFPLLLTIALVVAVLGVRYMRVRRAPPGR